MSATPDMATMIAEEWSKRTSKLAGRNLPAITVSTSQSDVERAAAVMSHAMLPNPLWRIWFPSTDTARLETYTTVTQHYLSSSLARGAFIIEAGDYSACAAWSPPGSHDPPGSSSDIGVEIPDDNEASLPNYTRETDNMLREEIWTKYGQDSWHLILLARDPRRKKVTGAVRAVLQPVIDRAAADGAPIWLTTSSEHAKDMYVHLGWRLTKTIVLGGHSTWCLILYPPIRL